MKKKYSVSSRDIFLFLSTFDLDYDFEFDVEICVARKPNAKMCIATKQYLSIAAVFGLVVRSASCIYLSSFTS